MTTAPVDWISPFMYSVPRSAAGSDSRLVLPLRSATKPSNDMAMPACTVAMGCSQEVADP